MQRFRSILVLVCVGSLGCGTFSEPFKQQIAVVKEENTNRYFSVVALPPGASDKERSLHYCLEEVGPAATLSSINLSGALKVGAVDASTSVAIAQTLGHIFDVPSVAQLSATTLYRLCEARANNDISKAQYYKLLFLLVGADATLVAESGPGSSVLETGNAGGTGPSLDGGVATSPDVRHPSPPPHGVQHPATGQGSQSQFFDFADKVMSLQ
jgi:hypothetical protein